MRVKPIKQFTNNESLNNDIFLKENNNESLINDMVRTRTARKTEYIADRLVSIFDAPQCRNFFLKCAWHLSEAVIWSAVESANKARIKSPVKYFVKICNTAMNK